MSDLLEMLSDVRNSEGIEPQTQQVCDEIAEQITKLEAKVERLTSRGIEDMQFTIQELEERVRELETVFSEFKIQKDADGKMVIQYWSGGGVVVENNKEDSIAGQVLYDLANHLLNKQQS